MSSLNRKLGNYCTVNSVWAKPPHGNVHFIMCKWTLAEAKYQIWRKVFSNTLTSYSNDPFNSYKIYDRKLLMSTIFVMTIIAILFFAGYKKNKTDSSLAKGIFVGKNSAKEREKVRHREIRWLFILLCRSGMMYTWPGTLVIMEGCTLWDWKPIRCGFLTSCSSTRK